MFQQLDGPGEGNHHKKLRILTEYEMHWIELIGKGLVGPRKDPESHVHDSPGGPFAEYEQQLDGFQTEWN